MEVYVDDMLVKSKEHPGHMKHLQETFELLQRYNMKLNPLKCAFRVSSDKFLGFMVTQRGIEASPLQLKVVMDSKAHATHSIDRLRPFFTTIKGAKWTRWKEECDQAFIAIKQYLTEPLILASPRARDTLYLYLVVLEVSVSSDLFKEDENRKQRPTFFVSKSLARAKTQYTHLEQAALALQVVAKKLRPYFQAHPIVVLTNLPLQNTIHKPDLSRRMARWEVELSEFGIQYKPRLTLKGQVSADFLA